MTAIKNTNNSNARAAKSKFMDAVSNGVSQLMGQHGYSRERATALLLHELKRGDKESTNHEAELLSVMKEYGIGLDEASKALVVSRAIQRATKERGLSVTDAIDELTSRMSLSNLLQQPNANVYVPQEAQAQQRTHKQTTEPSSSSSRGTVSRKVSTSRKAPKGGKHAGNKRAPKNHYKIQNTRKRKDEEPSQPSTTPSSTRRTRSDSVTEVVIAKKAKTMDEAARCASPPSRKRSHMDGAATSASTPLKRARADT